MDRILFVPSVGRSEWLHELLPEMDQLNLPVAGRSFIEYALECAKKFGFESAGILDWYLEGYPSTEGERPSGGGVPCVYRKGEGDIPRGLNDIEKTAAPFPDTVRDGLMVVWGLCMPSQAPDESTLEPLGDGECADTPQGLYCRWNGRWMRVNPPGLAVNDVRDWYRLNFALFENPGLFTLPGYSSEKDVHLGRSVVIERGTKVVPPVILQDNTWCARNVWLDGNVIVGRGSFVGEGAHLERTIVGNDTYVGVGLELVDKIVVGRRIIDTITGAWMDVEEPGLARSIDRFGLGWLRRIWRFLRGTSHGRRG